MPRSAFRHWLATVNTAFGVFLAGGIAAPVLALVGRQALADPLYAVYRATCHQWAFRSFFLFGPQPLAVYSQQQLRDLGLDPFSFTGSVDLGWKMAFCERDLAIYGALSLVGVIYARRRDLAPLGFAAYALLILPMALDGFTQLFGWRESTWDLRVGTGLLFGIASGWLVLPRLDIAFGLRPTFRQYAPVAQCDPPLTAQPDPAAPASSHG